MELTKAELEQVLTQVTKEYEELVKSEKSAKKVEKSALPMNKEETTEGSGENSKPEAPKAQDPMPEGSKDKVVAKAEGDEAPPKKEDKPEDVPPQEDKPSDSEVPAEVAPEVPAEQPPQEQAPEQMVSDDAMGPDQLLELYSGLSPEHLAAHWMAASQALFQSMSAEQAPPMDQVPNADPAPAQPVPPTEGMPPMAKTEVKDTEEFKSLKKSFDEAKAQNNDLEKKLEEVTDLLAKKLGMPVQNGVTSETAINKSETAVTTVISKAEVVDLLKSKAKEAKLSESDKQKIFKYSMNPEVTQELKDFLGLK